MLEVEIAVIHGMVVPVKNDVRLRADADLHSIFAEGRICWAGRGCRGASRGHHKAEWKITWEVHLVRYDLEEGRYARFGVAIKVCTHAAKVDLCFLVADFDYAFIALLVDEGPRIVDPATKW